MNKMSIDNYFHHNRLFYLLKKIKNFIQGSFIDIHFRYLINFLSYIYFKLINEKHNKTFNKVLIILYGGMGDCVLMCPLINELNKITKVDVLIEDKFLELKSLLPYNVTVQSYKKENIFNVLRLYKKNNLNFILLQQSPIFEFLIFNFLLGRPAVLGFIFNQRKIVIRGLKPFSKINIKTPVNKLKKYEILFLLIKEKIKLRKPSLVTSPKIDKKNLIQHKYFIFAPSKTPLWGGVGILNNEVYSNLLLKIRNQSKLLPVLVGTEEDKNSIFEIIKLLPKNFQLLNLVGKTSLKTLITLINEAEFVLSNDNGIHHLSNFLSKKVITLFTFSSADALKWNNTDSHIIFNKKFNCMPCIGNADGPFDNYPFKCPWQIRCKNTINENQIIKKMVLSKFI